MFYKKALCISGLIFLLVSTGSVFAVEPTTFPTNKVAPNKRTNKAGVSVVPTAAPENISKVKGTPGKQTVETAVPVEPKTAPKKAPGTRKK